jgi:hypothetical protein
MISVRILALQVSGLKQARVCHDSRLSCHHSLRSRKTSRLPYSFVSSAGHFRSPFMAVALFAALPNLSTVLASARAYKGGLPVPEVTVQFSSLFPLP